MKHEGSAWARLDSASQALLIRYEGLLESWAVPRGMIAASDLPHLRERHVLDSLRGAGHVPRDALTAVDLGSGAGLPGIPIAVALPRLRVLLTESRRTRIAFLELALSELELQNASVFPGRLEDLSPGFDVALARGFADPASTWRAAEALLSERGRLVYWAGARFQPEMLPEDALSVSLGDPGLESGGPIVIMARQ